MVVPQAYTNLSIFKRIEVWILLALTGAGLVFVLLTRDTTDSDGEKRLPGASPTEVNHSEGKATTFEKDTPLEVESIIVKREADRYIAEVRFQFDNQTDKPIHTTDAATILPESKKPARAFFLAFTNGSPVLPAKEKTSSSVHFSLHGEEIAGELTLRIGDTSTPLKSSRSFDPESIAVGSSETFTRLDW